MRITMHSRPPTPDYSTTVRLALGMLQMAGAVVALVLLGFVGVTPLSLTVVVLTGLCTSVSMLLFGGRETQTRGRKDGKP